MGRCLYVIRQADTLDDGDLGHLRYVKVGRSDWPRSRFPSIQNGCPFELELAAWFKDLGHMEHATHNALAKWHVRGEWYLLPDKITDDLLVQLKVKATDRGLEWKDLSTITWEEIDLELDKVELGDERGLVAVFHQFVDARLRHPSGRRGHVNLTNFSTHIRMPRHKLQMLVDEYEQSVLNETKETA